MWRFMVELVVNDGLDESAENEILITIMKSIGSTPKDYYWSQAYNLLNAIGSLSLTQPPQRRKILRLVDEAMKKIGSPTSRQIALVNVLRIACANEGYRTAFESYRQEYGVNYDNTLIRFWLRQRPLYHEVLLELKRGQKVEYWDRSIFPQLRDFDCIEACYYGIINQEEAKAYLANSILGPRLREVTEAVLTHFDKPIETIMGSKQNAMRLRSSMTLFDAVSPNDIFAQVLNVFFNGERDYMTLKYLAMKL